MAWFCTTPKYILTKFRDAKIDIFDIIEKCDILCFGNVSIRYDCVHKNTVISHMIYLKLAFAPVCIVSSGRLFVHKGNMACVGELQFSCNHNYVTAILKIDYRTFQNLFNLGLEYCASYGLFQAIKYSTAN